MASPDYYQLLQVDRKASPEIIKRAYRALCGLYHPDIVPPKERAEADRKMALINAAYQVLSDPQARRDYDRSRTNPASSVGCPASRTSAPPVPATDARRCYRHADRPRVSVCMMCGHSVCGECRTAEAMLVICPDCATSRKRSNTDRRPGAGSREAAQDIARNVPVPPTSPVAVFLKAGLLPQLMWGFVVLIALVAMLPLFLIASTNVIALRFPGATSFVWGTSIAMATLAAAAVGVVLITAGAYMRLRYVMLSVGILVCAMAFSLSQTRLIQEAGSASNEYQQGRYGRAAVGFTYALAMGDHSLAVSDSLGRSYLRLFLEKLGRSGYSPSNACTMYAKAALAVLDRNTQHSADRHKLGRSDPLVLDAGECVGLFLAAKTASAGASTKYLTTAERLLRPDPQREDQYPADQTRRVALGLTLFMHWQALTQGWDAKVRKLARPFSDLMGDDDGNRAPSPEQQLRRQAAECLNPFLRGKPKEWDAPQGPLHDDLLAARQKLFPAQPQNQAPAQTPEMTVQPGQQPAQGQPPPQVPQQSTEGPQQPQQSQPPAESQPTPQDQQSQERQSPQPGSQPVQARPPNQAEQPPAQGQPGSQRGQSASGSTEQGR